MVIAFKKLDPNAIIPTFANNDNENAGLDFYSLHSMSIAPHWCTIVDTGIAWDGGSINEPYTTRKVMIMQSRSGLAFNSSIEASNAGVIDSNYRGSIKVKLYNNSDETYHISKGDRIAQGIIYELPSLYIKEVSDIPASTRGTGGFGSSGS